MVWMYEFIISVCVCACLCVAPVWLVCTPLPLLLTKHHRDTFKNPLRLQNGCLPDQVPLGKQILSAEPYSVCPTAQVKRTLLRTLKFPASLLAWAGVPGSPQASAVSPASGEITIKGAMRTKKWRWHMLQVSVCLFADGLLFRMVWQRIMTALPSVKETDDAERI